LAELAGQLPYPGKLALLVPVGDVRDDLVRAEVPHGLPDGQLLLAEQGVDAGGVMRVKARPGRWRRRLRAHYPSVSALPAGDSGRVRRPGRPVRLRVWVGRLRQEA